LQLTGENGNNIEIYLANHRVFLSYWDEVQQKELVTIFTGSAPDMQAWNKVITTVDFASNSISLYVNNLLVGTASDVPLSIGRSTLTLGRRLHTGGEASDYYTGEMDKVAVDEALVAPENAGLYPR
jgi:hypothetical protein